MKHAALKLALIAILFTFVLEIGNALFGYKIEKICYSFDLDNNEEDNQNSKEKENEQESEKENAEDKIIRLLVQQMDYSRHLITSSSYDKNSIYFKFFQGVNFQSEVLMPPEV